MDRSGPTASPEYTSLGRAWGEEDNTPIALGGSRPVHSSKVLPLVAPIVSDRAVWSVRGRVSLVINDGHD